MNPTLVRWAHVTAAAVLLGGALLALAACRGRRAGPADRGGSLPMETGARFEWISWGAIGLAVMTGVGNLGAFGVHLQPATSRWGGFLLVKLTLLLFLLPLSLVRTLVVAKLRAAPETSRPSSTRSLLAALYAITLALILSITLLAAFLAHG